MHMRKAGTHRNVDGRKLKGASLSFAMGALCCGLRAHKA